MNINELINTDTPVIIEAGAGNGEDIERYSNLYPNGRLYTFEPNPEQYKHVYQLVGNKPNVKLYANALGEKTNDVLTFHISKNNGTPWGSSSLLKPKEHLKAHPSITFEETVSVKIVNLDDLVAKEQLTVIDFLELDIQGYEPIIVRSSPKTMSITKILYTEINTAEVYENNILYPEYKEMLEKIGFEEIEISFDGMQGNAIFRNENLV
jgi:FkbM family methyltransferase